MNEIGKDWILRTALEHGISSEQADLWIKIFVKRIEELALKIRSEYPPGSEDDDDLYADKGLAIDQLKAEWEI